jgi:hypothetical protein
MKIRILAVSLLLAFCFSNSGIAASGKSHVFDLIGNDGSKIATIHIDEQSLQYEFDNDSEVVAFTGDSMVSLHRKNKSYSIRSYADLESIASQKAAELSRSQINTDANTTMVLDLRNETQKFDGVKAQKLVRTTNGRTDAEFWVSSELAPPALRSLGEKLRKTLPKNYWAQVHGYPGMIEIIMLFGVPLRGTYQGSHTFQARAVGNSTSDVFRVPTDYKRVDN